MHTHIHTYPSLYLTITQHVELSQEYLRMSPNDPYHQILVLRTHHANTLEECAG